MREPHCVSVLLKTSRSDDPPPSPPSGCYRLCRVATTRRRAHARIAGDCGHCFALRLGRANWLCSEATRRRSDQIRADRRFLVKGPPFKGDHRKLAQLEARLRYSPKPGAALRSLWRPSKTRRRRPPSPRVSALARDVAEHRPRFRPGPPLAGAWTCPAPPFDAEVKRLLRLHAEQGGESPDAGRRSPPDCRHHHPGGGGDGNPSPHATRRKIIIMVRRRSALGLPPHCERFTTKGITYVYARLPGGPRIRLLSPLGSEAFSARIPQRPRSAAGPGRRGHSGQGQRARHRHRLSRRRRLPRPEARRAAQAACRDRALRREERAPHARQDGRRRHQGDDGEDPLAACRGGSGGRRCRRCAPGRPTRPRRCWRATPSPRSGRWRFPRRRRTGAGCPSTSPPSARAGRAAPSSGGRWRR